VVNLNLSLPDRLLAGGYRQLCKAVQMSGLPAAHIVSSFKPFHLTGKFGSKRLWVKQSNVINAGFAVSKGIPGGSRIQTKRAQNTGASNYDSVISRHDYQNL
jgi:hypothetical protein